MEAIKEEKEIEGSSQFPSIPANTPTLRIETPTEKAKRLAQLSILAGGRGKGKKTLLKEEVQKELYKKLLERSFKNLNTQTIIANGTLKVFKVVSEWVGVGKKKWLKKGKPQLVENDNEIMAAINWEYGDQEDEDEDPNSETEFFFITKQAPESVSLRNQLDRILGPIPKNVSMEFGEKTREAITGMHIVKDPKPNENTIQI